jgi:hypothetical protein
MSQLHLHQPACYRLVVGGHVGDGENGLWSYTFTCHYSHTAAGRSVTTLEGSLPDQAALHGILAHIRDWGLPLYLVQYLGDGPLSDQQQENVY